ncbi:hypothetical protein ONZ45_g9420 [Pleurotus djamor]|nr:hypothetical protein ONZ45_g9420 [Pleurotus djamor]
MSTEGRESKEFVEVKTGSEAGSILDQPGISPAERALVRKLDKRIMPILCALYLFAYLDRSNLGNARLQGLPEDALGGDPTGVSFDWVTSAFYFAYILCQIPASITSKLYQPRIWIAMAAIGWGTSATLMSTGFNIGGLIACRLFVGVFEAGFGPAIPLYFSFFYTRQEIGLRMAIWFGFATVAGAFGGLIAFGIQHASIPFKPWRLLFAVEGIPPILLGLLTLVLLPNRPESTTFFNEDERRIAIARMNRATSGDIGATINRAHIKAAFLDWRIYVGGLIYLGVNCALASIGAFLPTIIQTFGNSPAITQLLTVPPYAVAGLALVSLSFASDRLQSRGIFMALGSFIGAIGYLLLILFPLNIPVRYFATFCITSGTYTTIGLIMAWFAHNLGSETKRATGIPMFMAIGQCGSVLGSHIFPKTQGPRYVQGFAVSCAMEFMAAICSIILSLSYRKDNAWRDKTYGVPSPFEKVDTHELADKMTEYDGPHPHPYLHEPLLYITNVPSYVTDDNIALAFATCGPFRPKIPRDTSAQMLSGTVEFKFQEKAEKALATLQSRAIPGLQQHVPLVLSPYPPTNPPTPLPPPSAIPRLVKHLPPGYTDSQLYDLFRAFGALASARTQAQFGPDTGIVEFWNEDDAKQAEDALHCAEVDGQNIAVQLYQPRRTSTSTEFSPNAPAFVPATSMYPYTYSPPRASPYRSPAQPPFIHGPGQQVQLAPSAGPGSTSHSGLIDPCNLFCKNLDPDLDSNSLFSHFRQAGARLFGQIVSARVMRNENGESRGFGFVSYQTPEQASAALHAMNGTIIGNKQIVVRLHEPKQLRQEKLAQRFGHNGHPRSASGATSPTLSEGGESYAAGWGSPRHHASPLGSPRASLYERPDRGRRGSGSYYNAALQGTLNLPMRYDDLSTLSPVVRKEVLTGELSRRVKSLNLVPSSEIEAVVDSLVAMSLSEVVQCIENNDKLADHVQHVTDRLAPPKSSPEKSPSPSISQDSHLLDPSAAATASAPEHPSTPISVNASLSTPPRTSSPSGSVPPTSERDRMAAAINKLESSRQSELTNLLMSLPKRERALCLFNIEVLRAKLADAKMVLESESDDENKAETQSTKSAPSAPPMTPQTKKTTTSKVVDSPQTPDLSSRGPSAASSPLPSTPGGGITYTIASLAKLPAAEIIRVANSSSSANLGLPKADPLVTQGTDEFIDGLLDKPVQVQKQQLGDKLFKVVKSFGFKGAPKVTIALLDQEDLRALAHLMNSYPSVLREKVQGILPAK